jgi:hypothetical protein
VVSSLEQAAIKTRQARKIEFQMLIDERYKPSPLTIGLLGQFNLPHNVDFTCKGGLARGVRKQAA